MDDNMKNIHEHTHTHEHTHAHDHVHKHTHEHAHSHEHSHKHAHEHDDPGHSHESLHPQGAAPEHDHSHGGQSADEKETYALVRYMLSHNKHHARELGELGGKLDAAGKHEAAGLIANAVSLFEQGNLELEKAARLLD